MRLFDFKVNRAVRFWGRFGGADRSQPRVEPTACEGMRNGYTDKNKTGLLGLKGTYSYSADGSRAIIA